MPTAQSADGVLHEFPDGTPPAVIDRVMKGYATKSTAPAQPASPESKPLAPTDLPAPQPSLPAARKIVPEALSDEKVNVGGLLPVSTSLGQKRRIERGPSKFNIFDPEAGVFSPIVEGSKVATGKRPVGDLTPGEVLGMAAVGAGGSVVRGARGALRGAAKAEETPKPADAPPRAAEVPAPVKGGETPGPILDPPPGVETTKGMATRIDDGLYRLRKNDTADKIEATQFLQGLDKTSMDPRFQERVYTEIEQRMANPKAPVSPEVQQFVDQHLKPWKEEENTLASDLKRRLGKDANLMDLPGHEEGYVHRVVQGRGRYFDRLDPDAARQQDPVMGSGRTLSKHASSLQPRKFWVLEDSTGKRSWVGSGNADWAAGQTRRGTDGRPYTTNLATTAEIESHTPVRYHKNATINTIDNVLRLRRVTRNLDLLDQLKTQLSEGCK